MSLATPSRLSEARAVFDGLKERLDHLGADIVAVEVVELLEPEVEAGGVGVAAQIAEVLHLHEGAVELGADEGVLLNHLEEHARARLAVREQSDDERGALLLRERH